MTNNKEPFLQTLYFLVRALIDFRKENNICIQEQANVKVNLFCLNFC